MPAACRPEIFPAHQRVDEAAMAAAHDGIPPARRAVVKQCLALLHGLMGERADETIRARDDAARGFQTQTRSTPAPWACFFMGAGYAAPTRLAAALMPAILARVPLLAAACVGEPSPSVLLALELAGVEDVFRVDDATSWPDRLRQSIGRDMGDGRVVLLHAGGLASAAEAARSAGLNVWEETRPPRLRVDPESRRFMDIINFCHPDARHTSDAPDAVFSAVPPDPGHDVPLHIHPHMAGFWMHPGLDTAFFQRRTLRMAPPRAKNTT